MRSTISYFCISLHLSRYCYCSLCMVSSVKRTVFDVLMPIRLVFIHYHSFCETDCSDVCVHVLILITLTFLDYTSYFSSGFVICVECKALSCIMQDCIFVLFCSKFILTDPYRLSGTALCIFVLLHSAHFSFSALCCDVFTFIAYWQ